MPVETLPNSSGAPALFVVCDKRSDTNRVAISPDHLTQWQASAVSVAKFVAQRLSLRWQGTNASHGDALDVQAVEQLVNTSTTSDARYTPSNVKREARKLETKARYESWQKEYRRRKKEHPDGSDTWCAIQISKMPIGGGKSVETIRKNMK